MKAPDLVGTAVTHTLRARTRTLLTVLALFIGAFTLTITNGLGTGINRYIDTTIASIGAEDVLTITKIDEGTQGETQEGPREYDPDTLATQGNSGAPTAEAPPGMGTASTAMTGEDIDVLAAIDGVEKVRPVQAVTTDYIRHGDGTEYTIGIGALVDGQELQLAAGREPEDDTEAFQVALPVSYVEPLGFDDEADALGATVTLGLTDGEHAARTVEATVVGVVEETFALGGGSGNAIPNEALLDHLAAVQNEGLPAEQQDRYTQASVWFDTTSTEEEVDALRDRIENAGYASTTVAEQIGAFRTVIDGIVLVLNAFTVLALAAASLGIVNTLLMSVQERTREIGLMKAMGMGGGRIFSLFSLEAAFIGFLGSVIGVVVAVSAGTLVSDALSASLLADLPGLTLIAFEPTTIALTIVLIMFVAFLAGTLPAARAARKDPVEALRYE